MNNNVCLATMCAIELLNCLVDANADMRFIQNANNKNNKKRQISKCNSNRNYMAGTIRSIENLPKLSQQNTTDLIAVCRKFSFKSLLPFSASANKRIFTHISHKFQ